MADLSDQTHQIRVAKAMLWEAAKGKMRAMVSVEGQCNSAAPEHRAHRERYAEAGKRIEQFITDFEDHGLHE